MRKNKKEDFMKKRICIIILLNTVFAFFNSRDSDTLDENSNVIHGFTDKNYSKCFVTDYPVCWAYWGKGYGD